MDMEKHDPAALAKACADNMWAGDEASKHLGMEITHIAPGQATLTMKVQPYMTNGVEICHGGLIFSLADSAFAFACNGYNQVTVAQHCSVSFLNPGRVGDLLKAEAQEVIRKGRSGIYDVVVTNQDQEKIAIFRGHSRTVNGTHIKNMGRGVIG